MYNQQNWRVAHLIIYGVTSIDANSDEDTANTLNQLEQTAVEVETLMDSNLLQINT